MECRVTIMKSLIIIWLVVLAVIVGGSAYMNHAIGQMIVEMPDSHTSVLTPRSTLTVQSSDSSTLQPAGAVYEDETRPSDVIQPTMLDNDLQHMKNSWFMQGTEWGYEVTYDPSLAEDVTLSNGVQPLVVNGSVYNVQGVRF